jgi:hypothetical protein
MAMLGDLESAPPPLHRCKKFFRKIAMCGKSWSVQDVRRRVAWAVASAERAADCGLCGRHLGV